MASLMIGIDFYDTEVYVGLWAEEERCAKSFSVPWLAEEKHTQIPLFVVPAEDGSFISGHEGIKYSIREKCDGASAIYGKNAKDRLIVNKKEYDVSELLSGFIGNILTSMKRHFGGASVARLCITGSRLGPVERERFKKALELLGFKDEQYDILTHANAYMRYMLHLAEEQRKTRASAIDLDAVGALVYSYVPYDNKSGAPCYVLSEDMAPKLSTDLSSIKDDEEKIRTFEMIVNNALSKNLPLKKIFATGKSVEDEKIMNVLKKYATDSLRIFSGQNLYSLGACYMAVNEPLKERVIYEGQTLYGIFMEGFKDSLIDAVPLIPPGTDLDKAEKTVQIILDKTKEIVFHIFDVRNGNRWPVTFVPEDLKIRDNKTDRLEVKVSFLDIQTLVIKVRDIGFGSLYPATYRVWEQVVSL